MTGAVIGENAVEIPPPAAGGRPVICPCCILWISAGDPDTGAGGPPAEAGSWPPIAFGCRIS